MEKTLAKRKTSDESKNDKVVRTLRFRIKDKHASLLNAHAREVNFVWNYCNELSHRSIREHGKFLSAYDLQKYTNGSTKEGLSLQGHTVQEIGKEYVTRRSQFKKSKLRWRVSDRTKSNRSLGWIPFKKGSVLYRAGQVFHNGRLFSLWDSYGLENFVLGAGSFSEDARGRWYLNVTVEKSKKEKSSGRKSVGIDLGLKDFLTTSDGFKEEGARFYRDLEESIATAQRAGKKDRVRALHAKVKNRRKDALHKLSTALVEQYGAVFVGNVNASALAKSRMAKSVLDAGWTAFRTMLRYKCDDAGVWFDEVPEQYSSVTCSVCNSRTGPSGLVGLRIREWTCHACGTAHDRDVNAARNILAAGHRRLAEGNPSV